MARKKFELDEDIENLVDTYIETTDVDWNDLINKSLKCYITTKLGSKEVREILKKSNSDASKYLDEYVRNNIDSHWNI